ncbi:MAG TPA: ATP-grasp fold amidoligase family protein, partial [Kiritimatiellia bacterium]|nr:ATP-grasp fold amidoligase family protein [Kiritimatiellia bacterium]
WLKLHDRRPEQTRWVDKYEVRKLIAGLVGEDHLFPLLGVWDRAEDVDFDRLPDRFVLKCTHDSGGTVICRDKSRFDVRAARRKLAAGLKRNYYWAGREWAYKDVRPRIIAEPLMADESGTELKDYKFFCFDGEPRLIQVDFDRFANHKRNLYDLEWRYQPFQLMFPRSRARDPQARQSRRGSGVRSPDHPQGAVHADGPVSHRTADLFRGVHVAPWRRGGTIPARVLRRTTGHLDSAAGSLGDSSAPRPARRP